jgi:hypothetical protein
MVEVSTAIHCTFFPCSHPSSLAKSRGSPGAWDVHAQVSGLAGSTPHQAVRDGIRAQSRPGSITRNQARKLDRRNFPQPPRYGPLTSKHFYSATLETFSHPRFNFSFHTIPPGFLWPIVVDCR